MIQKDIVDSYIFLFFYKQMHFAVKNGFERNITQERKKIKCPGGGRRKKTFFFMDNQTFFQERFYVLWKKGASCGIVWGCSYTGNNQPERGENMSYINAEIKNCLAKNIFP